MDHNGHSNQRSTSPAGPAAADSSDIDARLKSLRTRIGDLGDEIDSYRSGTAASYGGAVFLLLIAVGGFYDLAAGNSGIYRSIALSQPMFKWLVLVFAVLGLALLVRARRRSGSGVRQKEGELERLENEYARLLERRSD